MKQREQAMALLEKARHDEVLVEEVLSTNRVTDDMIGFHCQQAIEKLLKAVLSLHGVRYRKTHDLRELMDLLTDAGSPVPEDLQEMDRFTPYASLFRYEAIPADALLDRRKALELVRPVRAWAELQVVPET